MTEATVEADFIDVNKFYNTVEESAPEEPTETGETPETEETETEEVEVDEAETETEEHESDSKQYSFDEESGMYTFRANDKDVEANTDKLVELAQKGLGFEKNSKRLKDRDASRAKEHKEAIESVNNQAKELGALADSMTAILEEEQKALDDQLEYIDFAEYTKRNNALKLRREEIDKAKAKAREVDQAKTNHDASREFKSLRDAMDWNTDEKLEAGMEFINSYAKAKGLTQEDVKGVLSHKIYMALHDAAKYHELMAKKDSKVKEVKSAPKSVKSKATTKTEKAKVPPWERLYKPV